MSWTIAVDVGVVTSANFDLRTGLGLVVGDRKDGLLGLVGVGEVMKAVISAVSCWW